MAKDRKIGWRIRLRRKLRQQRQEDAIRLKDKEKRAKKGLDDEPLDENPEIDETEQNETVGLSEDMLENLSKKVWLAEKQLKESGQDVSENESPLETMFQYGAYFNGADLDDESFEDFQRETTLEMFEETFSRSNSEDFESAEFFGEKIKAGLQKAFGKKPKEETEKQSISEIANDIKTIYPNKAKRLLELSKKHEVDSMGGSVSFGSIFIGALIGYLAAKLLS